MNKANALIGTLFATLAIACSPGGVNTGGGGGNPLGPDAGLPTSGRVTSGLVAYYRFDEGSGPVVYDQSNVLPALDLTIANEGAVTWLPEGGLRINAATVLSTGPATRISQECQASNSVTVEVWAKTSDIDQTGPARLVDFSVGPNATNFMIGQNGSETEAHLRTTDTVELETGVGITSSLTDVFGTLDTHLVYTRSGITDDYGLWVNGARAETGQLAGAFLNWLPNASLTIGNEPIGNRPWRGNLHTVAIYCRSLGPDEIVRNHGEGF